MLSTRKELDEHVHKMLAKLPPGREVCAITAKYIFFFLQRLRNNMRPPFMHARMYPYAYACVSASLCVCVTTRVCAKKPLEAKTNALFFATQAHQQQ